MEELFKQIKNCRKCETIGGHHKFPSKSHGNQKPLAFIVSEAPGKDSLGKKKYWVGTGGKILRECLPYKTTLEDIFYLTDIVKCWPNDYSGKNRKPKENEIENCSFFLTKEIHNLQPKIILSFGKTSSSFLLKREVEITREHGKITTYNDKTKLITLLHPSRIDRFMDRNLYKRQLSQLFEKIIQNDLNIEEIFKGGATSNQPKAKGNTTKSIIGLRKIRKGIFTIPSSGNSITEGDASKNQIRITADLKDYFPSISTNIHIEYKQEVYNVKFCYRNNRSHVLKLGKSLANRINLKAGMKIKMVFLEKGKYSIE
ncbi:uracil-DNA glycosylase family protein [Pseudozobellia thermophila]|uniref:Uracil-DNA glycosylase, family 4 n=1 Tax=Pseudozobellia thermophila TaxID=192903 RepID=A0A1M6NSL2_9FLAO|nr:uracil-DNA glycosylase family protein [Pseudozobellia thermophila]SHJ98711.1 uracil-DNA glycosylase, family 4 [Pseudozobellia thermophila]